MDKTRKLFFLTILAAALLMFSSVAVASTKCPRCHGAGVVKTQYSIASYGVSTEKTKCPNCGRMIMKNESHSDPCASCGGTGYVGGRSSSGSGSSARSSEADGSDFLASLPPADAMRFQELSKQLYTGRPVPIVCDVCHGSGLCKQCGGFHNLDLDAAAYQRCQVCGGDGFCIGCRGKGNLGIKYEAVSESEKQAIISEMRGIVQKAYPDMNPDEVMTPQGNDGLSPSPVPVPTNAPQGRSLSAVKILFLIGIAGFLVIIAFLLFMLLRRR